MVVLAAKNYYCSEGNSEDDDKKEKFSCKGVQNTKHNEKILCAESYIAVVSHQVSLKAENRGFRIDKKTQSIVTYSQEKAAFGYYYDKRQVQTDGISTIPLPI